MRGFANGVRLTLRYWMQTEVHVYAFSVAANVLLSFFPFLTVSLSRARLLFHEEAVISAMNLALRDYFPNALQQFLVRNLPHQGPIARDIYPAACCSPPTACSSPWKSR